MYQPIDQIKTGKKLRVMLEMAGYDVKSIQEYLHLSCPQSIYKWYKGKALPSLEYVSALSDLLDVHMEELIVLQNESFIHSLYGYVKDEGLKRLFLYVHCLERMA